jgi:hypothetical protein
MRQRKTIQLNPLCLKCPLFRDNVCQGWSRGSTPLCEMTEDYLYETGRLHHFKNSTRGIKGGAKTVRRKVKPAVKRNAKKKRK